MRIRKRFLSLSAAITASPSLDLHADAHHQPLLLLQQPQLHPNGRNLRVLYDNNKSQPSDPPRPPSSDHTTQIGLRPSTWLSSGAGSDPTDPLVFPQKKESGKKKEIIKNNDSGSKESILSAETSSNHLGLKGWLERDRLIPIKKRRGNFGEKVGYDIGEDNGVSTDRTTKLKPKKKKKKGKRGNVIKEGSRCSRVNGRGWRCCQQTLVGYSLCEHHLGKGRLRSMTSIRGRGQKGAPRKHDKETEDDHNNGEEEFKYLEEDSVSSVSKKKKIGVVKARSLSSLLGQISS